MPVLASSPIDAWYRQLVKPDWNLPGELFGPIWPPLCVLTGFAMYRVVRHDGPHLPAALGWFFLQMVLSALWALLFFHFHRPGLALACIVTLWFSIIGMMRAFARVSPISSAMLAPYLLYVTFSAAYTAAIWQLNR